jgi:hypothetical protein
MRLHDVQVVLSAADAANRFQFQNQQQAQIAQAQEAGTINAQAEVKKTQTQEAVQEQGSKEINDTEGRLRERKKGNPEGRGGGKKKEDEPRAQGSADHIIDIKA